MPYIERQARELFDAGADALALSVGSPGELNYVLSRIVQMYSLRQPESYANYNEVIGVLESAKLEFYRTQVAPYENKKRSENGNVLETP